MRYDVNRQGKYSLPEVASKKATSLSSDPAGVEQTSTLAWS
jgi:hypothetical protein